MCLRMHRAPAVLKGWCFLAAPTLAVPPPLLPLQDPAARCLVVHSNLHDFYGSDGAPAEMQFRQARSAVLPAKVAVCQLSDAGWWLALSACCHFTPACITCC